MICPSDIAVHEGNIDDIWKVNQRRGTTNILLVCSRRSPLIMSPHHSYIYTHTDKHAHMI